MIRRKNGVSPVIAVILMVAITVVLAATAWLMVSGMMANVDVPPTHITLLPLDTQYNISQRIVEVGGMERTYNLYNFEVSLSVNDTADYASSMDPLRDDTQGNITFMDMNADGRLNQGDRFVVSIVPGATYRLMIFWKEDGTQVGITEWDEK